MPHKEKLKIHAHSDECANVWKCKFVKEQAAVTERLYTLLPEIQKLTAWILSWLNANNKSLDDSSKILSTISPENCSVEELSAAIIKLTDLVLSQKERTESAVQSMLSVNEELRKENESLQTDQLTWLNNRHKYWKEFSMLTKKFAESGHIFSCAIIDIDDFKKINDTHWHLVWDAVLKYLAKRLLKHLERNVVFRFWWEEFLFLYPGDKSELMEQLNKVLQFFNTSRLVYKGKVHIPLTFSGWVTNYKEWDDEDSIYTRADEIMYAVKKSWKNKVITD